MSEASRGHAARRAGLVSVVTVDRSATEGLTGALRSHRIRIILTELPPAAALRENLCMARLIAIGFWADYSHPSWPDPRELVNHDADERERREVADYLDRGTKVQVYRGWSYCRICGYDRNGDADLSDGTYLWPEGLAHYVREHQVQLPGQFTAHIAARLAELRRAETDMEWWVGQYPSRISVVRLVAEDGAPPISTERWQEVSALILEQQPARSVWREWPPAIRIASYGGTEVAPGLLADVGRLTGTTLRVAPHEVNGQ